MQNTTNYRLNKPDLTDLVDIQKLNDNADIIDNELFRRALKTDIKVNSVSTKTGDITLDKSDVGLNNVNNWGASSDIDNESKTTYATANAVKQAYDKALEILNSSTDGKKKLATAITNKGVLTSASDTFANMAQNINKISTLTIDGQKVNSDLTLKSIGDKYLRLTDLPYYFIEGCALVYKDEIHILGSGDTSGNMSHYKWNGSSWTTVSTLPYKFKNGCAVVYNDEIHILGGSSEDTITGVSFNKHYKWDGKSWTNVSTIPYNFINGSAVVYNNEIHILGSAYSRYSVSDNGKIYGTNHYKWNGSSWTTVSTLPLVFHHGSVLIYRNEMHMLGGNNDGISDRHYKWNGSSWVTVSTLKTSGYKSSAVVYNNQIHMPGSYGNSDYYAWNGVEWIKKTNVPSSTGISIVYNNKIILLYQSISYSICNNCCIFI